MYVIPYGTGSEVELEFDGETSVTICDAPRGTPLQDLAQQLQQVLDSPLEFPPLSKSVVAGDKVVLALESGVPRASTLVSRTIEALLKSGIDASGITVLSTGVMPGSDSFSELPVEIREAVTWQAHDPRDRERLSYLAAATDASPIYINRAIHDADFVISIGAIRLPHTLGYHGIYSGIFPAFSDSATQAQFRSPKATRAKEQDRLRTQADEVGWLLGSQFTIQVVPGAGDDALHVLAGEQQSVLREGERLCRDAWSFRVPGRVELVVAAIGGDATQQTWENLARVLAAASRVLDENGDVIVCSHLNEAMGPGLERIVGADDLHVALREISREKPADSLSAAQLGSALERGRVYLLSDLPDDRIEELGVYPLDADNVSQVANRYGSCVVLTNAQYAQARPVSESEPIESSQPRI